MKCTIVANVTLMKTSEMLLKLISRAVAKAVGTTAEEISNYCISLYKQFNLKNDKHNKNENKYSDIFVSRTKNLV
jgi:hypothetical protein